ncbi:NTP-PPase_u4 domain containing protein [uncultured Caudovirales phage]|uniref:NTP-PPase_u4 domain containing protein n=1 Tax=uncultured Caudovirales phage TaxID=2100421 RepID=A0A6J5NIJ6_9CAUD|nr:NTP-PPase_u4 domain containing protein [uncultured Caudovirales phage]
MNTQVKALADLDMTYEQFVEGLFKPMAKRADELIHAAAGVSGEAGELLDAVKKHWAYGKDLDVTNVIEELGDIEFYMQALRTSLSLTRQEILEANVEKLLRRYPAVRYSDAAAIARLDKVKDREL